jgi:hypothetical protein
MIGVILVNNGGCTVAVRTDNQTAASIAGNCITPAPMGTVAITFPEEISSTLIPLFLRHTV